jgi:hypothetical protein
LKTNISWLRAQDPARTIPGGFQAGKWFAGIKALRRMRAQKGCT